MRMISFIKFGTLLGRRFLGVYFFCIYERVMYNRTVRKPSIFALEVLWKMESFITHQYFLRRLLWKLRVHQIINSHEIKFDSIPI